MTKSKYNLVFWLRNAEVIKNLNPTKSLLVTIYAYEYHGTDYQLVFDIHILYINTNFLIHRGTLLGVWKNNKVHGEYHVFCIELQNLN